MPRPSYSWKGSCAALALLWVGCQAGSTGEGTRALASAGSDGGPGATGCGADPIVIHDCDLAGGNEVDTYTPGALPELNLVGIYRPYDRGEATVHVEAGGPMVLALSASDRTHWTITADAGAIIERVILVGYHLQTATAPGGVAVESHSYDGGEFLDNYCGFDWPPEGRGCDQRPTPDCCTDVLIEMVEEYAGRKLTAFAGCSVASDATVRGCDCPALSCAAPAPLTLECAGPGGAEVTDPRIADWLDDATATGGCGALTIAHDAPAAFLSSCAGEPSPTVVTFTATDERGNTATCASDVTVLDTTAPRVALTQTAACLWPPSHAQVGVATVDVSDICDPDAAVAVTASSDERTSTEIGAGGPAKCPDARLVDGVVELRAERAGPSGADNGRVYGAVGVTASDRCGNTAEAALPVGTAPGCPGAVCVPHDHNSQAACTAVDDGQTDATVCN